MNWVEGALSRCSTTTVASLLLAACGPQVSTTSGGDDGTGNADGTTTEAPSGTSEPDSSSETTAHVVECGDALFEEAEWCFDRLSVDIADLGLEQAFRVVATPDGLIVWGDNGFSLLSATEDSPAFENSPFYPLPGYFPGAVIYLAKLTSLDSGRPDLIFWSPVEVMPDIDPSLRLQLVYLSPGASRPEPGSDFAIHEISELDYARDDLVAPIDFDGEGRDEVFAYDRHSRFGAVYHGPSPDIDRPTGFSVEPIQLMDTELPCPPAAIHTGDFDGDEREDGVVVAPGCPAQEDATLYAFAGETKRPLNPDPSSLALPLQGETFTLDVYDFNEDNFDDLVVAEPGRLLLLRGSSNGLQEATTLDATPVEVVIDGPAHIEGSERPLLTLARGQFDTATELEVLVNSDAGITVVSAESGVVGEFPDPAGSFASFDINADGVSDVALIVDAQVVVSRSNP